MLEQPSLSYIKELSGGDTEFELKIITVIKKEFPLEKAIYFKNLKEKKYKEVAEIVHKLKHKISILDLEKSYEVAIEYENNLNSCNTILKEEFESVLLNMTNFLNTI
ncbi:Hpt domain-containing protein [Mariniflexile sp. AS56]|uniref:Hpt domain-containing protein n=1 Tax=Mariniflexile sp. AS56 TaxID=3063957 RepID=UPI0026F1E81B|nr:Hpt domain-containing protein [Mariniflexile sp. AS56]MDO7171530.1 Hpt domain-containing protein [Mariniflexile sp. AS56]